MKLSKLLFFLFFIYSQSSMASSYIVDAGTNICLRNDNADVLIAPASLAKLMTINIVLQSLRQGKIKPDQFIDITTDIWRKGGAPSGGYTMFAANNSKVLVSDLVNGLIVDNANDAAIALAIAIAGNEDNFAVLMNQEAKRLGLLHSHYLDSTGLMPGQITTLLDSTKLLQYLVENFSEYTKIASKSDFTWNKITQRNKNFFINNKDDVVGIAGIVAHDKEFGQLYVGYVSKEHHNLYIANSGEKSATLRYKKLIQELNWAYSNFKNSVIFKQNEEVTKIPVYAGIKKQVNAVAANKITALVSKDNDKFTRIFIEYPSPLVAPIVKGQKIGYIKIMNNNKVVKLFNLLAGENINEAGIIKKFKSAIYQSTIGFLLRFIENKLYSLHVNSV